MWVGFLFCGDEQRWGFQMQKWFRNRSNIPKVSPHREVISETPAGEKFSENSSIWPIFISQIWTWTIVVIPWLNYSIKNNLCWWLILKIIICHYVGSILNISCKQGPHFQCSVPRIHNVFTTPKLILFEWLVKFHFSAPHGEVYQATFLSTAGLEQCSTSFK